MGTGVRGTGIFFCAGCDTLWDAHGEGSTLCWSCSGPGSPLLPLPDAIQDGSS